MIEWTVKTIITATLNFFREMFSEWLKIRKEERQIENISKEFEVVGSDLDVFDDVKFNNRPDG